MAQTLRYTSLSVNLKNSLFDIKSNNIKVFIKYCLLSIGCLWGEDFDLQPSGYSQILYKSIG